MSRPLARSGQWSQTTTGISQPAARLMKAIPTQTFHSKNYACLKSPASPTVGFR